MKTIIVGIRWFTQQCSRIVGLTNISRADCPCDAGLGDQAILTVPGRLRPQPCAC